MSMGSQIHALANDLQQAGTRVQEAVVAEAHAATAQIEAEAKQTQQALAVTFTEAGVQITGAPDVVDNLDLGALADQFSAAAAEAGARVVGGQ